MARLISVFAPFVVRPGVVAAPPLGAWNEAANHGVCLALPSHIPSILGIYLTGALTFTPAFQAGSCQRLACSRGRSSCVGEASQRLVGYGW